MNYEYDSWNRILNIRYPDNETVCYTYDLGGNLDRVYGRYYKIALTKDGGEQDYDSPESDNAGDDETDGTGPGGHVNPPILTFYYNYIDSIRYDKFGNRTDVWYGNGTRAGYAYDVLQRMTNLGLKNRNNAFLQNIAYTYDKAGNITKAQNTSAFQNSLGGSYSHTYTYDSLYRLTSSVASKKSATPYTLNMTYLPDGRISSKYVSSTANFEGTTVTSTKTMSYSYNTKHSPYQVVTTDFSNNTLTPVISTATYTWNVNGNLTLDAHNHTNTTFSWDEENRLTNYVSSTTCGYYLYDAGGERYYKCSGMFYYFVWNGHGTSYYAYSSPVLYASQYLVVSANEYTKHYYAGNERIASRIGEGRFPALNSHCVANSLLAAKKTAANANLPSTHYASNSFTWFHTLTDNTAAKAPIYWTHGDHLGSTAWATDTAGAGVQHFRYLPFGEPLYSKKTGTFSSRYTFSGKERDSESGLNYFGARYYNSDLSIWLSVDPMVDKYPNLSPYVYCANNPVRMVDWDGREIEDKPYLLFNGEKGVLQIWDDSNTPEDYFDDTFIGEYSAHNNVTKSSKGKWEDGIYEMLDQEYSHKHGNRTDVNGVLLDSPNGSYGSSGCYRAKNFTEKMTTNIRIGMAVHAGREHKPFKSRKTEGCVRTTPEAMIKIADAISTYGPLTRIIIQNNRFSPNSESASKISPQSLPPLQIDPLLSPIFLPDKTKVAMPCLP